MTRVGSGWGPAGTMLLGRTALPGWPGPAGSLCWCSRALTQRRAELHGCLLTGETQQLSNSSSQQCILFHVRAHQSKFWTQTEVTMCDYCAVAGLILKPFPSLWFAPLLWSVPGALLGDTEVGLCLDAPLELHLKQVAS